MKKHNCGFGFIVILLCAFFAAQHISCSSTSGVTFNPQLAKQLKQSLDRSIEELEIPGAVMAVRVPDGSTWIGVSGYAVVPQGSADSLKAVSGGEAMSVDRFFRIASVTKSFTATIILELVDEGKLALDDTIDEIMARWFTPGYFDFTIPYSDKITLRNILEMRSGMVEYGSTKEFNDLLATNPLKKLTPVDIMRMSALSTDPAPYAPDTKMQYCNTNFTLQGIIIEQVTKNRYEDEIKNRLLTPLGMTHTWAAEGNLMPAPYAHGYLFDEGQLKDVSEAMDASFTWGGGSIISTGPDMIVWVKALEDGKFLSEATQKERMTMKEGVIEGWPVSYGLGIYNDNGAVGHYGNYVNYYTAYCMRYKGYDFAVLENGELKEHHEEGRHPARSIFWNAVRDIGLLTE